MTSGFGSAAEVFADALELPAEERAAFLDQMCADAPELRAEVESLLAAHAAGAAEFLQQPLRIPSSEKLLAELFRGVAPGTRVGPYEVVRLVASGGMGAVYLAERTDGTFHMRVAIKLIHPALWGTDAFQRFRTERQVLADLEHPGIARLIDGGSTDDDLPYLVMEFVEGTRIDRYCDEQHLDLHARLKLFLEVCDAIHFAHQNLVIHRDLKPSNIFVDGSGRVKLLDFGIAKVLGDANAPEREDLTVGRFTPNYASPEQVLGQRMTTATDIYSLGVVLYELVTGRLPYEHATPEGSAPPVAQDAPEPPSRRARDPQTARGLRGDLDTILLKALQRDPARRYLTVDDFGADIRRHLGGLPVQARPDTAAYVISKFVSRHRGLVASTVAAIVVIIAALIGVLAAYRQATMARHEAEWQAYVASLAAAESSIRADNVEEAASHLEAAPAHLRAWEWWHLRARVDRSLATFRAHRKGITRMALLSGERLVTASIDSTIKIWNMRSSQLLQSFGPFSSEVETVAPVHGTPLLAAGLNDGRVLLVDGTDGDARELHPPTLGWAFVTMSPDGTRLACGFFDGSVHVWSVPEGVEVATWKAHDGLAMPAYSADGRFLASGGGNGSVVLYDARTLARLHEFRPHARRVYCLAFSPDGSRLVTGSMDQTVCVFDTGHREILQTFREHHATPNAIAFDPDGASVLTAASDGRFLHWNLLTGQVVGEFRGHWNDVNALAGDSARVISADWNGVVKTWSWRTEDVRTLRVTSVWMVPPIYDAACAPGEDRIAAATNAGSIPRWDLPTGARREDASDTPVRSVAYSPDGAFLVTADEEGTLKLYREPDPAPTRIVVAHRSKILEMAFAPDGRALATASADSSVQLWRFPSLEPIRSLAGHRGAVEDVEFAPDGQTLASCGDDGTIRLWDPASGRAMGVLEGGGPVQDVAFDPRGTRLASASRGGGLRLWDVRAMRQVDPLGQHARVLSVAWSHDGTRIAAGAVDGILRLYDVASRREVMSLHGHVTGITSLQFSRDDSLLTSSSLDGTIRLWDSRRR